ncbi:MAG TPA: adenylate/guanylate cyclase domain-containing protein [Gemmataceae bacterium]|nr:adenylate/guanylate cyclase domain-containing protein [Gemmataceae bacterium]
MLQVRVWNKIERQEIEHLSGPLEFGRGPARDDVPRCVLQDLYVSKDHVRVLELEDGRVRIENLSQRNSIRVADGPVLAVGTSREIVPPVHLTVGETTVEIERPLPDSGERLLQTIASPFPRKMDSSVHTTLTELGRSPSPETLAHWFETVIAVQRAAAGSPEFYQQTARAIVTLVGLDRGLVLLRRDGRWIVQARYPEDPMHFGREYSMTTLERVVRERHTLFQSAHSSPSSSESLQGIEAVAASPIFDPRDEVVGVVYGCRSRFTLHAGLGIGTLEAQVMQLLASVVGVGLARQEQEARALRRLVQLEQFFPGDMAREMEQDPHVLDGQERQVTVLFSDIRGFSRMAERLGPMDTFRLASDVMDRLTARVQEAGGIVVHYAGDGLMALWNAPKDVPDHAARACRAALAMLADQPALDADWQERLGRPVRLGIGLNTGLALCGNTGSKQKFHYGALGHAVNVASRVEGATKQFGIPIIITGSTHAQLMPTGETPVPPGGGPISFATRRLCRVRLVGIDGITELHELHGETATESWQEWTATYERGLALYEAGRWLEACRTLQSLLFAEAEHDRPTLMLLSRATQALQEPPEPFDPVIDLERK